MENPMMASRVFAVAALAAGSLLAANASAQAPEGKFRGMYVCEKLPLTRDILRAPLDLVIDGGSVQFARPLFNLDGTRVVGSELGKGTVNPDGSLHLTSEWSYLGNTAQGDYSGTLTSKGGTLVGTQTWSGPDGTVPISRTCTAALVPAPKFPHGNP
jgi:hypothetical protein